MSAAEKYADGFAGDEETTGSVLAAAPDAVEIRRNGGLAALVGVTSSAVAIAYLGRATQTGVLLDWVLFGVMALVGVLHLRAFVDARTPLLVADGQGVRLRLGRAWHGLPWGALAAVEHTPRRGLLRDGRLVLVPHNAERVLAELDGAGRRQSRVSDRLYGAPFAVPLGLTTRVGALEEDLTTALRQLAGASARVVELVPEVDEPPVTPAETVVETVVDAPEETDEETRPLRRLPDPRPRVAALIAVLAAPLRRRETDEDATDEEWPEDEVDGQTDDEAADGTDGTADVTGPDAPEHPAARVETDPEPATGLVASATPSPLRAPRLGRRTEVTATLTSDAGTEEPLEGRGLRRAGSVDLVEDTQVWGDRVRPIARVADAVEPLVIDGFETEPAEDPVIGPEIVAARTRIGITVDRLAERTRIRPHVIEAIEVDDFAPCGGDFYARGHLRTLARVLGVDAGPLLAAYDDRYADAPINPRRVFEAELASSASGGIRSTRGGPNWSVLLAVVMTLVLAWSVARLVTDAPAEIQSPAPLLNGSGGTPQAAAPAETVTLKVTAEGQSTLLVRNGRGTVVFDAPVEFGEVHRIDVRPPVTVQASDAGAITVAVDGQGRGTVGADGRAGRKTYRVD